MKTKDLIKHLQEIDPKGEFEVCIENSDIEYIDVLPAYYDGRITVIKERDKYMRSLKSEVTGAGTKINLFRHDWTEKFANAITDDLEEYIVESGGGAMGQNGYNWLDAEVISRKIKITHMVDIYYFLDNINEIKVFTENLRTKYVEYISGHLNEYINKQLKKSMITPALELVRKCQEINFPLEVFRHGTDYVINQNRQWSGYEFKIDNDGKFYVKDQVNNKQTEKIENGHSYNITPFVETDIMKFDFKQVKDDYIKVLSRTDNF